MVREHQAGEVGVRGSVAGPYPGETNISLPCSDERSAILRRLRSAPEALKCITADSNNGLLAGRKKAPYCSQ